MFQASCDALLCLLDDSTGGVEKHITLQWRKKERKEEIINGCQEKREHEITSVRAYL